VRALVSDDDDEENDAFPAYSTKIMEDLEKKFAETMLSPRMRISLFSELEYNFCSGAEDLEKKEKE
jgi:hypothetical protein